MGVCNEIRCLVTGATGYVGGRLVPVLLERGHAVRALARNPDKLADVPWRDRRRGRARRPRRSGLAEHEAFDGVDVVYYLVHSMGTESDFVAAEARSARNVVAAAQRAGRETAGVSGRAAPVGSGSVAAPAVTGRGRRDPAGLRHRDRRAAGRDRDRFRLGVVRDDAPPHQPPARDDDPEVGAQQDPADRDRRRAALSGRGGHRRRAYVTHLGHRRPGRAGVRRRDAGVCRRGRPAAAAHHRDSVPDTDDREPVDRPRHAHAAGPRAAADRITGSRCGDEANTTSTPSIGRRRKAAPDIAMRSQMRCSAARCPSDPHWAHVGRTTPN